MADQVAESGAAAEVPQGFEFIGGFAPGQTAAEPLFTPEKPAEPVAEAKPAAEAPKTETKPAEEETPLSKLIRQQREEREGRQAEAKRRTDAEQRAQQLEADLAKLKTQDDPFKDPGGWARSRQMTPEQQLMFASALIYDVRPEKAPQELRFQLFEQKQAREKAAAEAQQRAEEAKRQEAAQKAAAEAETQKLQSYVEDLKVAAKAFEPGSFPESQAWFDTDHDTYARSLFATANNMAEAAQRAGKVADLSPSNVAKVLEADLAGRQARRDARRGSAGKTQSPGNPVVPKQGTGETSSTKGLGAGAPRGPAMTEEERIRRASEVAFRSK